MLFPIAFCLLLAHSVDAITESCDVNHQTPCGIIQVQNIVYKAVEAIEAATNAIELEQVYSDITNQTVQTYRAPGQFSAIVLDENGVNQAYGGAGGAYLIGTPFTALVLYQHIISTPNVGSLIWYSAQPGGGTFLEFLWSNSPTVPPLVISSYLLPATLYNGHTVSVGSLYQVLDPGQSVSATCSAQEFQTCASQSAPSLAAFTLTFLFLEPTDAYFQSVLTQINTHEYFAINGGFYPFIVNISNSGTLIASGQYPEFVGKKWSDIANHYGAKTVENLDETLIEHALIGRVNWASVPWLGASDQEDADKKIFIVPFERDGYFYYLGVAINDPYPYIEYSDYQVPSMLLNLNIALTAIIGSIFLGIIVTFFYEMRSVLIRMSSPLFLITSLLGGILLSCTSILYMLFPTTNGDATICSLRAWLLPTGLTLMIAPILAKTYRVSVLIRAMKKVSYLTGCNLAAGSLIFAIPAIIIVAASPKSTISSDIFTSVSQYTYLSQCQDVPSMYGLLIAYYAALVIGCFYYAYLIKDAPDGFNEATYIYVACSFLLVYGILVIPVQFLLETSPIALAVLRSFGILLGTLVFEGSITFPKIYHIIKGDHNSKELHQKRTYKTNNASSYVVPLGTGTEGGLSKLDAEQEQPNNEA